MATDRLEHRVCVFVVEVLLREHHELSPAQLPPANGVLLLLVPGYPKPCQLKSGIWSSVEGLAMVGTWSSVEGLAMVGTWSSVEGLAMVGTWSSVEGLAMVGTWSSVEGLAMVGT